MRVPLPNRMNLRYLVVIVIALAAVQIFEGTEPGFAGLGAVFILVWGLSFNACEGFLYPTGGLIFFGGLSTAVIGLFWKAIIVEPAQRNLVVPNKTMIVYIASMAAAGLAASFAHRVSYKKGILSSFAAGENMKFAAIGCLIVGVALDFTAGDGGDPGSLTSALRQFNQFNRMAIVLATTYEVQSSGGKRTLNWIVFAAGSFLLWHGLVGFSKEGIFTPFLTWLLPAIVAGANFTKKHLIVIGLLGFFLIHWMVPYSQYGRQSREEIYDFDSAVRTVSKYLFDLEGTRVASQELEERIDLTDAIHYYDTPQGLADREQMLAPDDALIQATDQYGTFGMWPTLHMYLNAIPHFIWKNKPIENIGNVYAHQIGEVGEDDDTTGISFSPWGDAYHQAGWLGVAFLVPLVVFLYGFINDSLCGSIRRSPWPLLAILLGAHAIPQGLLDGIVYFTTDGVFALLLIASLSKWVLPLVAKLVTGGDRTRVIRAPEFRSRARPLSPVDPDVVV